MPLSWTVTPQMREEHFDFHGYMVKDSEVLTWYTRNYSKKEKTHKESVKIKER